MMNFSSMLWGVLIPGLIAGIGLLGLGRRAESRDQRAAPLQSLLIGASFFIAYWGLFERPPLPFGERTLAGLDWMLWLTASLGILFSILSAGGLARLARTLLVGGAFALVLSAMWRHHWDTQETILWIGGMTFLFGLSSYSLESLQRRNPGVTLPLVLILLMTGLALGAGLSGSAKLGQSTGILCACLGAATIVSWMQAGFRFTDGALGLILYTGFSLALCAYFFSELQAIDALLLAASPHMAWLGERASVQRRGPLLALLLRLGWVAIPIAIVVARAILAFEPDPYASYG